MGKGPKYLTVLPEEVKRVGRPIKVELSRGTLGYKPCVTRRKAAWYAKQEGFNEDTFNAYSIHGDTIYLYWVGPPKGPRPVGKEYDPSVRRAWDADRDMRESRLGRRY